MTNELSNEITEEQFDTFTRLARVADYLRENRAGNKLATVIAINRAIKIIDDAKREVVYAIRHDPDYARPEPEFDRINHGPFEHPVSE